MEDKIFDMGKQKPVAGVVRDSWQHQPSFLGDRHLCLLVLWE